MKMHTRFLATFAAAPMLLSLGMSAAHADIAGVSGPAFELWARSGTIVLGDGNSLTAWGYSANAAGGISYPGPTLIVNQGDAVVITLHNGLLVPVSMIFPGQANVSAADCGGSSAGLMTLEATAAAALNGAGGCVTYSFTPSSPGTYLYQSGTRPELEVEMGLVGALIVRPTDYAAGSFDLHPNRIAYGNVGLPGYQPTHFDREYLFFLTDIDRSAHEAVDTRQQAIAAGTAATFDDAALDAVPGAVIDPAGYKATLWFLNGRNGPDTMLQRNVNWLPSQPYNALPRAHPGERVLMRIIGGGRDLHPFHHHGNNTWLVARDGRLLESSAGASANYPDFDCVPELDPNYATHVSAGACPTPANAAASKSGVPLQATVPNDAISNFTIQIVPGNTYDALFTWTGKLLNWDIYGNQSGHIPDLIAPVVVDNASFEAPVIGDAVSSTTDPTDWTDGGQGGNNVFTFNPPAAGVFQPTQGANVAAARQNGQLRQNLNPTGFALQAGRTYRVRVDVGRGPDVNTGGASCAGTGNTVGNCFAGYTVQLRTCDNADCSNSTIVTDGSIAVTGTAARTAGVPAVNGYVTIEIPYTATGTETGLQIRLQANDGGGGDNDHRTYFDDVRLVVDPDPTVVCNESTRLPGEDPVSHCHVFNDAMGLRTFPVTLPEQQSLTFGGFWSGGPYLGTAELIPPLQGGLNPGAGYSFMWHSHTERELTNDDIFPGGMMTMFIVEQAPAGGDPDNICDDGSFGITCPAP